MVFAGCRTPTTTHFDRRGFKGAAFQGLWRWNRRNAGLPLLKGRGVVLFT